MLHSGQQRPRHTPRTSPSDSFSSAHSPLQFACDCRQRWLKIARPQPCVNLCHANLRPPAAFVGARYIVPGTVPWRDAAHSPKIPESLLRRNAYHLRTRLSHSYSASFWPARRSPMNFQSSEFEFRARFWFIAGIFFFGFFLYNIDHVNRSEELSRLFLGGHPDDNSAAFGHT